MTRPSKYLEKRIVCLLFCVALIAAGNAQSSISANAQKDDTLATLVAKGRYFEETGRAGLAIDLLTAALPAARSSNPELYASALKYMALAQRRHGNNDSAVQYYERYVQALDTLMTKKLSRASADAIANLAEARRQASQKQERPAAPSVAGGLPPRSAEALRKGEQAKPGQDNRLQVLEQNNTAHTRRASVLGLIALGIIFLLLYLLFRNKEKAARLHDQQNDQIEALNAQLALANETKVKLFSIIGRDLRSPASQIVHWLQLQKENPGLFDEESRLRQQEKVTTAAATVLQTMEDLLLWSKSLRQHFTPQLTPTDLSAVVRKELNFLQQRIQEKGLRISTDIPPDFLPLTDENFASVIIRNLLQNAIRHSNEGSTISIRAGGSDLRITNPSPLIDTRALNALLHDRAMDGSSSGLGLKIANDLAAVIHTEIVFTRSADGYLTALLSWKS
jgi:signal transduction histidine kinase